MVEDLKKDMEVYGNILKKDMVFYGSIPIKNHTWAPHCCTLPVTFKLFFFIMFPFGFQYLVIIYIDFKFNLNFIKYYIHGG
jgi:hypothetical protein